MGATAMQCANADVHLPKSSVCSHTSNVVCCSASKLSCVLHSMHTEEMHMVQGLSEEWPNRVDLHQCQVVELRGGGGGGVTG